MTAELRIYDQATDTAGYQIGERVIYEHPDGTEREGVISGMFIGPVSGLWVYEVHGDGFYADEIRPAPEPKEAA